MKYYKLSPKNIMEEINKEDIRIINLTKIKPAKIYKENDCYYGVGEASKKFLSTVQKARRIRRSKMNKEIEDYWDRIANNWMEKIENE